MTNSANLNSFLKLGYYLDYPKPEVAVDISSVQKSHYFNVPNEELIREGQKLLSRTVSARFRSNQLHCVPLSGGLDSRVILGDLLKHTEAKNIKTFTFGIPGALDYELGNAVALIAGTNHVSFDLRQYPYTVDDLIDVSRRSNNQTLLFLHPPVTELDRLFEGCVVWSGFLGGELAGAHLPKVSAITQEVAKQKFLDKNTLTNRIVDLTRSDEEALCELVDFNTLDNSDVSYEEQLDFCNRQTKFIAPHLMLKGLRYEMPFLDPMLINFFLGIPDSMRRNETLYKQIVLRSCPELFSVGIKSNYGARINKTGLGVFRRRVVCRMRQELSRGTSAVTNPMTNYIDFERAIRERDDLRNIVHANLVDLDRRGIVDWVNAESLFNEHLNGSVDNTFALLILCSLEIHLKAGKILD